MELAIEQVLTQIVAFLIMYLVLKKFAWKPLLKLMDERKELIASDFESIKNGKNEIQAIKDDYKNRLKAIEDESKVKIREAVNEGHRLAEEIAVQARLDAKAILNKAKLEMEKEIRDAKNHLKDQMVGISMSLAKKVIREELDLKKHNDLIQEALQQVEE